MSELRNPHDLFFRETFSRLEVARDFMANYLPVEVTAVLDLSTLELQKDSFIDPDLREHFSDMLYRVWLRDGNEANVYLLLEHKSSPDVQVALQLLRYMVRHWERAQRDKIRPLPPVIPIVVYHGREKWQVSENFTGLFEGPEALRPYWPNFRYELQDLSRYSVEDIRGGIILRVVSMLLMGIFDPTLSGRLPGIFRLLKEWDDEQSAMELLEKALRYLSATARDIDDNTIRAALNEVFKNDGGSIMGGFVEKWIEHGKQEGLKEGKQEGLEEGRQQEIRNSILDLLLLRFDAASPAIADRLGQITDLETLRQLNRRAATADSLTTFEQYLETLK
jgi:predicted transposase/invertase (TIGR01784 family)